MMRSRILGILIIVFSLMVSGTASAQSRTDAQLVDSLVRVADSLRLATQVGTNPDSLLRRTYSMQGGDRQTVTVQDTLQKADSTAVAQTNTASGPYVLNGVVKDRATAEGIPFANIFFPGTNEGTTSDINGRFSLTFNTPPGDSFMVQALGYANVFRRFNRNNHSSDLTIELTRNVMELETFTFHAGEDPALALLKKIIRNKPANDPDRLQNYKYEVYNKLEVDIRNLTRKQFESLPVPMIKKFSFIYNNLDTTTEKTPFLPFFLTETISDYYYQHSPKRAKEFIRASQVKGAKNESVDQFLGAMYQNINAYTNNILVFDKLFVSPISNNGAFYYKYKIKDTQEAYGHKIILVQFAPKRSGENCFYGDFWVADSVWALQRISMEVPKDANINWVKRVSLYQEYAPVHDSLWFCIKDKFVSDFVLPYSNKLPGFIGRKTTSYRNIVVNNDSIGQVVNNAKLKEDVIVLDSARTHSEDYWATARHDTLNKNERAIYSMIDTLNNLPAFVRFKKLMKFFVKGTIAVGPVEFGPYYNLYSSNPVEGQRFRLGITTNQKLFKDAVFTAYGAYGLKDQRYKYYGSAFWILDRKPRTYLFASYRHDVDRSNNYYDESLGADNIFGNIGRKAGVAYKMAFVNDARFEVFKSYESGFSHMLTFQRRSFDPYDPLPSAGIFKDSEGRDEESVTHTEVGIRLRYAWKETFLENGYYRISMGSKYPITEVRYGLGLKGVLGGEYNYQKASISVSDYVKVPHFGSLYYNVFAGKYFGTLPYPLLEVHPGNEFYYYNRNAFNMMNRFEFISDQYVGFNLENNFGGGIFNYIPYLKKAKLRQFWTAKGIIGSLSESNKELNFKKGYSFRSLDGAPYIELGTGVENILQIFRIDFVWRVTPKPLPDEDRAHYFGIFGSVRFQF